MNTPLRGERFPSSTFELGSLVHTIPIGPFGYWGRIDLIPKSSRLGRYKQRVTEKPARIADLILFVREGVVYVFALAVA